MVGIAQEWERVIYYSGLLIVAVKIKCFFFFANLKIPNFIQLWKYCRSPKLSKGVWALIGIWERFGYGLVQRSFTLPFNDTISTNSHLTNNLLNLSCCHLPFLFWFTETWKTYEAALIIFYLDEAEWKWHSAVKTDLFPREWEIWN